MTRPGVIALQRICASPYWVASEAQSIFIAAFEAA
ncbi:hypothetical protein ACVWYH_002356 [Bradyrhizobium sp. GM24.11]|jgi:hypothetical protein